MKEPELEENALTARVADGRLTIERRSTDPAPPGEVTVTDPDGKTETVKLTPTAPGRATVTLPAATPGVWQVTDGGRTAYAAAGAANPPEFADLRATAALMRKLARASGGGVHFMARQRTRRPRCRNCAEPSPIGRLQAAPGSVCSAGTITW